MQLLILNGPNLNLLGLREPAIYGTQNYAALEAFCKAACREAGFGCKVFQSNHEGTLIDAIQASRAGFGGIVINDFVLVMMLGIVIGTYSSIFIATPLATMWHRKIGASKA